jgi:cyclase
MEFLERPPRYRGPNLDPAGARLRPKRLAEGVYALMAFPPPRDNSGLIVGQHGALVIDAGINTAMARQIQQTVRRLTDRPILWLASTVYHGDHTFGNAAFPAGTKIIASRQTAQSMTDVDAEKRARAQNLDAIAEVTSWRRPDVVFDDHTEVDLGGRIVQLWHFGPGNSPGDTVVWVPGAGVAADSVTSGMR